jgi:predicted tellurium resistance membrane protein TerC
MPSPFFSPKQNPPPPRIQNTTNQVDGARVATPLLLVLICVELSDVVFAVDSVPAVFGVTKVRLMRLRLRLRLRLMGLRLGIGGGDW